MTLREKLEEKLTAYGMFESQAKANLLRYAIEPSELSAKRMRPLLKNAKERTLGAGIMAAFVLLAALIIVEVMLVCAKPEHKTQVNTEHHGK